SDIRPSRCGTCRAPGCVCSGGWRRWRWSSGASLRCRAGGAACGAGGGARRLGICFWPLGALAPSLDALAFLALGAPLDVLVGHLAHVLGADVVGVEDAVEVVDLVLEDAGEPTLGAHPNLFAL